MRLTVFLLVFSVIQVWGGNSYSQITKLSLNLKDATVQQVLDEIENLSEFYFLYSGKLVDVDRKVDIDVKNKKIKDILSDLFTGEDINCLVMDRQILLSPKYITERINVTRDRQPQEIVVKGKVTDEDGNPLPGVNIIIKGTLTGTITDLDGNYSIEVEDPDAILVFSFIGFRTQEVEISGRTAINITLTEDIIGLEEVVAIGYGTVKRSDLTGSVSSIDESSFNKGHYISVDDLITGRVAGVNINQTSSEPGGGVTIRIRGASSITAGNEPLYVIDGLPLDNISITATGTNIPNNTAPRNPLNSLNSNDIESIEILKDASATAIYGSRGANGVILITTKRGSTGKTKINYNASYGIQSVAKKLDVLSAADHIDIINAIEMEQSGSPMYLDEYITNVGDGTDWQDIVLRQGQIHNHNLSLSGGSEKLKYFTSLNYINQTGIVISSGLEKYTARLNIENNVSKKLKFGFNLFTSFLEDEYLPFGRSFNQAAGVMSTAIHMDPTLPVYDEEGNYYQTNEVDYDNPLAIAYGIDSKGKRYNTLGNLFAEYSIITDLKVRVNFGGNFESFKRKSYNSTITRQASPLGGVGSIINAEKLNYLFETTLNYTKTIKDHSFTLLGGYTFEYFSNSQFSGDISGFPNDATKTNNLALGNRETANLSSNKSDHKLLSYIGRANYAYKNKYLLTASIRVDGSSRFGANNKFGYFPSFAAAWKLSEEPFISDLDIFSSLKLRTSWGETGNQDIGNYQSILTLGPGGSATLGGTSIVGVQPIRMPNPDLKWERTVQVNIGLDMGFLYGKINTTFDYFVKNTNDLLFDFPVPASSGYTTITQNIGSVRNSGYEFTLNFKNQFSRSKNIFLDVGLNLAVIDNEVTDLGGLSEIITGSLPFTQQITIIKPGFPINSYYGYQITGIFQEGDDIIDSPTPNAQPGHPIIKDVNENGSITGADRVPIGDPFPDFVAGLNGTFGMGNFEFTFYMQGEYGAEILNQNMIESLYPIETRRNRYAEPLLNRWTPENPSTKWPSLVNPSAYAGGVVNNLTVEDASFIRLQSVQLSYNVSTQKISFINSLRLSVTGQNLLVFTNYRGYDPKVNVFGYSNMVADYNAYPSARTILFGINVDF